MTSALERILRDDLQWHTDDVDYWTWTGRKSAGDLRRCTRNLRRTLTACLEYWGMRDA